MTLFKKHSASQRHPAGAFLLTLLMGLLLWLVAVSLVRGTQQAAAAEQNSSPVISFTPTPVLAQKDPADKPNAAKAGSKPDRKKSAAKAKKADGKQADGKKSSAEQKAEFSPAEEIAVQKFVAANHAELEQVLSSLKKKHAREYARAINDLSHTQSRLEQVRRNDEARYRRELESWQLKSRMQLLVARIKMSPGDENLQAELKAAVTEQVKQQREHLAAERVRLAERLEKIDAQLERLASDPDLQVEQRMKQWLASAEKDRGKHAQKKKASDGSAEGQNRWKVKLKAPAEPAGEVQQ